MFVLRAGHGFLRIALIFCVKYKFYFDHLYLTIVIFVNKFPEVLLEFPHTFRRNEYLKSRVATGEGL